MSRLRFNEVATPSTPATGKAEVYVSNDADPLVRVVDDAGKNNSLTDINNASVASQTPADETRTYIVGSNIKVPSTKLKIGTILRWTFNMTKVAGTATSLVEIAFGTAGTTADTKRVEFTKPAGTGVADEAFVEVVAIVRGPLTNACVVSGEFMLVHNLAATGHAQIPCVVVNNVSAGFDMTTVTNVGLCITSGLNDAITIQQVTAEAINL